MALRTRLLRPAPAWAGALVAFFVVACFGLAGWAFAFPLTFCDSPSWAPDYLAGLIGVPRIDVLPRGALVPAWFRLWGGLSLASGCAGLIGGVQGGVLLAAVLGVLAWLWRGMTWVELLVLPALALSGLRHALYGQAVLSEALAIPLGLGVALGLLRVGVPSRRACVALGVAAALAAGVRVESLLLLGFVLARIALSPLPWRERAQRAGLALGVALALLATFARLSPPARNESIAETMLLAEWMRYTEPPRTAPARWLHFELVDRLAAETAGGGITEILGGLAPARRILAGPGAPDALALGRLLAYQLANRPLAVLGDRLATLADLSASAYASFWPGYPRWSSYYGRYAEVFARWELGDFQASRFPCRDFARAQAARFQLAPVRSASAFHALKALHAGGEVYARWVLRPLFWLALPACAWLLLRRRAHPGYGWLTALVFGPLALHAAFVCADERYQLPVDLLTVAWLSLTLRQALAPAPPAEVSAQVGER